MYAVRSNETIRIYDSFAYRGSIKDMQDRFYDAVDKCWVVPLTKENVVTLGLLGATLDEELQALTADETDIKGNAEPTIKPPIKGSLYSHQVKAYNFALKQFDTGKAVAFLMDMGTCKTITTIALIGALKSQKRIGKVLVVSPKSIVGVWEEEFQKFADYRYALTILDGSIAKKKAAFGYMNGSALQVIVVNYESAWRLETEIGKLNPDMIVCDESSKIKNPTTAQSKALHKLGKKTKFNVILTGTPVTNNPLDFFSQYKFLDEEILGPSYYLFRNRYDVMGGRQFRGIYVLRITSACRWQYPYPDKKQCLTLKKRSIKRRSFVFAVWGNVINFRRGKSFPAF